MKFQNMLTFLVLKCFFPSQKKLLVNQFRENDVACE